jgi:multidrug resistance protein, MATE family
VGRAYGRSDYVGLRRAAAIGFAVTTVFGVVVGLAVFPGARMVAMVYTSDPKVIALAAGALILSCLFYLPDGMQVVVAQALRARGDVVAPTITHLASYILLMVPLAYGLAIPFGWGITGIAWAVIIAGYVSAGLLLGRFWMLARRD